MPASVYSRSNLLNGFMFPSGVGVNVIGVANNLDPDQSPSNSASDRDQRCLHTNILYFYCCSWQDKVENL